MNSCLALSFHFSLHIGFIKDIKYVFFIIFKILGGILPAHPNRRWHIGNKSFLIFLTMGVILSIYIGDNLKNFLLLSFIAFRISLFHWFSLLANYSIIFQRWPSDWILMAF